MMMDAIMSLLVSIFMLAIAAVLLLISVLLQIILPFYPAVLLIFIAIPKGIFALCDYRNSKKKETGV